MAISRRHKRARRTARNAARRRDQHDHLRGDIAGTGRTKADSILMRLIAKINRIMKGKQTMQIS